jgi:toxin-antitoxin system PIN domain toxin
LALALSRHIHHRTALQWFRGVTEAASIVFCRATQQTLLRLLTNSSVLAPYGNPPLSNAQAWKAYEAFAADDRVTMRIDEPTELESQWKRLAARNTASPKLWMDAYLAAFAITADLRLVTTDSTFRQFAGLDLLVLK